MRTPDNRLAAEWRRPTKCDNSSGNCIEVATLGTDVAIRDSKDPNTAILVFTRGEWAAFVAGVKAGEFDQ